MRNVVGTAAVAAAATGVEQSVVCSEPLVHGRAKVSTHGAAIPLINWSERNISVLNVTVRLQSVTARTKVSLASGKAVRRLTADEDGAVACCTYVLSMDGGDADAIILRG